MARRWRGRGHGPHPAHPRNDQPQGEAVRPCLIIEPPSYEHYDYAELEALVEAIFDALPKPEAARVHRKTTRPLDTSGGRVVLPGDDLNARGDWNWILAGHYDYVKTENGTDYWMRVGSTSGARWNATTGHARDEDRFYTWSPESIFEPRVPYNKHAAYTLINFGSLSADAFRQSTKQLAAEGFGGQLPELNRAVDVTSLVKPAAPATPVLNQAVDNQQPEQAALAVQANQALPVLDHDGLPSFTTDVYTTQPWDDMGLVSMYSSVFCGGLRYINAMDEWRVWNGQRWVRDDRQLHQLGARKLATGLRDYARQAERDGNEHAKEMKAAAAKLISMGKVMSVPKMARTDTCMSSMPKDYDTHKYLVTVENGTLNVKTGQLSDFDPDLMLTKKIKAVFDPQAEGPRTAAFLTQIQPDPEVLAYP